MSVGLTSLPPQGPEWRRSGRFFLFAVALHLAVLAWPLGKVLDLPPPTTLSVKLVEALRPAPAPEAPPVISPPKPPPAAPAKPTPSKAPPVLAMTPEQQAPAQGIPVVAAPTPPDPALRPAAVANPPPATPAPVVAARYNAAYLNNPEPKYPPMSRRLGEEGKVLLRVRVTADGLAATVDLEKSSNFERLDEAAKQAVARWRFVPAKRGEEAIEATVVVPIVFRLDN